MSSQYDDMMGTEMRQEDHPDNSMSYKMAGDVVQFPISMPTSDNYRLTAPINSKEKPASTHPIYNPPRNRPGTGLDNVIKLPIPGVD